MKHKPLEDLAVMQPDGWPCFCAFWKRQCAHCKVKEQINGQESQTTTTMAGAERLPQWKGR